MSVHGTIEVDERYCKGCALCLPVCPPGVLGLAMNRITSKGYHPVELTAEGCTGCALCAVVCPDAAITVFQTRPLRQKTRSGLNLERSIQ